MEIRLRKPGMKLLLPGISVLAILAAVLVTVLNQQSRGELHQILIAKRDIALGEPVDASNTITTTTTQDTSTYLNKLRPGFVAGQTILKGQLIPRQVVSTTRDSRTPIRFNGLQTVSEQLGIGDHVDVWATPNNNQVGAGAEIVAFDAIVTKILNTSNMAINQTAVELRINPDYLVGILEAKANSLAIELVLKETEADHS